MDTTLQDILLLADWNTRVVVIGTMLLGAAAGVAGTFLVLRKRALLADAVSHCMLPGVVIGFMVMQSFGGSGKSLVGLLIGAAIAGLATAWMVPVLRRATRLRDDAIMGVLLGGGFGLGIALLSIAQGLPGGNQAGLETFIFGKTASMVHSDTIGIAVVALLTLLVGVGMAKEFRLLCFDESFAAVIGRRVGLIDGLLMMLAVTVVVIGLQSVGLILVIALLIIPAAAARFWTYSFLKMVIISALIGAGACWLGASISAAAPRLPAGAIIVLTLGVFFAVSMIFGIRGGGVRRWWAAARLKHRTEQHHLLRSFFEAQESTGRAELSIGDLVAIRHWGAAVVRRLLRSGVRSGHVAESVNGSWRLTAVGQLEADRVVRNHRLWEIYLIEHADIAASHVYRDADLVEHVLGDALVAELEKALHKRGRMVPSPHVIAVDAGLQP